MYLFIYEIVQIIINSSTKYGESQFVSNNIYLSNKWPKNSISFLFINEIFDSALFDSKEIICSSLDYTLHFFHQTFEYIAVLNVNETWGCHEQKLK
jgi:hypothetical protein